MAMTTAPRSLLRKLPQSRPVLWLAALAVLFALVLAGRSLIAQVEGDRGIAAVVSSSDIEVGDIEVDVRGKDAKDAREAGWREAQRKAWEKLDGPSLSDSQLDGIVSSIVIEKERIGPRRYIATLGVIFDRARANQYLGGSGRRAQSAPMMLLPVTITGGATQIYESRSPWQRAWAEYQAGASRIAYVRPSGAGSDSLLLTYGQTGRRSRLWWRNILDEFQAADVLIAAARLDYRYPGGPVDAQFTARHGPDNAYLGRFTMTAENAADLPRMMRQAVKRFDKIFTRALEDGKLKPNPSLDFQSGGIDPALQRLIDIGRAAEAQDRADRAARDRSRERAESDAADEPAETPTPVVTNSFVVQFPSADAAAIDLTLAAVRGTPGVRGAATTSLAIGGTSVMNVTYAGSLAELAAALRGRGFTVNQGSNALAISR
ncbi:MAG: heavy-metal-associated domain-containing protein [Pontixanthobacter sp.]